MPRNTKGRRKSKNHGLSEASKKKLDAIGVEAQILDGLLADFEIQSTWLEFTWVSEIYDSIPFIIPCSWDICQAVKVYIYHHSQETRAL